VSARTVDFIIAAFIIAFSILLLGQLEGIPREGYIFPSILLYSMIGCSIIIFIRAWVKGNRIDKINVFKDVPVGRWLTVISIFVLYVIGMFHLGFFTSTLLAAMAIVTVLSTERKQRTLFINFIFSISLTIIFYLFFVKLMMVRFPEALLI
jgi:hypothetical protein